MISNLSKKDEPMPVASSSLSHNYAQQVPNSTLNTRDVSKSKRKNFKNMFFSPNGSKTEPHSKLNSQLASKNPSPVRESFQPSIKGKPPTQMKHGAKQYKPGKSHLYDDGGFMEDSYQRRTREDGISFESASGSANVHNGLSSTGTPLTYKAKVGMG